MATKKKPAAKKRKPAKRDVVQKDRLNVMREACDKGFACSPLGIGHDLRVASDKLFGSSITLLNTCGDGLGKYVESRTDDDGDPYYALLFEDYGDTKDPDHGKPHLVNDMVEGLAKVLLHAQRLAYIVGIPIERLVDRAIELHFHPEADVKQEESTDD